MTLIPDVSTYYEPWALVAKSFIKRIAPSSLPDFSMYTWFVVINALFLGLSQKHEGRRAGWWFWVQGGLLGEDT